MGERVETLMNTFKEGAQISGKEISIYLTGSMFSDEEKKEIYQHLPEGCYFQSHNSDKVKAISSMVSGYFPVKGMFDPLDFLKDMKAVKNEETQTIFISFRVSYDRGYERLDVTDQFIEMFAENYNIQPKEGVIAELQAIHEICEEWAGEEYAESLFKAFLALEEANKYKSAVLQGISGMYWGVSTRQITRPLVIAPQLLTAEEEAYFLPHVFNPSEIEARMDYTDIHGAHRTAPSGAATRYVQRLGKAINLLDRVGTDAPEKQLINNLATGLRIYSSIIRSAGNFAEAQEIRDRNADKLQAPPHRPDKIPTWEGDQDLQKFNTIMRDELDNAQELIDILENGGMDFICHAEDPAYEDTFLLGPDLIEQLKLKRKIMLKHWVDIEGYLTTPFK